MRLKELMKAEKDDRVIASYTLTLFSWMLNTDTTPLVEILEHYEDKEDYEICEGMNLAIEMISTKLESAIASSPNALLTMETSNKIFKELLIEVYEGYLEGNKEQTG